MPVIFITIKIDASKLFPVFCFQQGVAIVFFKCFLLVSFYFPPNAIKKMAR